MGWRKIVFSPGELNLQNTLFSGQVFNWSCFEYEYAGWVNSDFIRIKQDQDTILWKMKGTESDLADYFNLQVDLSSLYNSWDADPLFSQVARLKPGIRIIKQPKFECIISFICSQNSHIKRITRNLETIRSTFGEFVCRKLGRDWYSFPGPAQLSRATEEDFKGLGLGYRAKYIVSTTSYILEKGGEEWLGALQNLPYEDLKHELLELSGVGPKVADCIILFAFNYFDVVPIDTHMWQIAREHYLVNSSLPLTKQTYIQAVAVFREAFGEYAGWAHSILYSARITQQLPLKRKKK